MITLQTFGPAFGLPDPSPFVTKADVLLKMSGLPYEVKRADVRKAPKGKLPVITDGGTTIADSTFIRRHLEERHGIDFDAGLDAPAKAAAWAFEKMCEDHLYWAVMDSRWTRNEDFDKGPRRFFDPVPAPVRPLVIAMVRREFRRNLWGHGMGRHTPAEIAYLGSRDIDALADFLGSKTWLMGETPCGADATVYAFLVGTLCPLFSGPLQKRAAGHANLVAYVERAKAKWHGGVAP